MTITKFDKFRRYIAKQLLKAESIEEKEFLKAILFEIDCFNDPVSKED